EVSQNIAAILAAYPGERIDMIDAREREAKAQGKKPPSGHRFLPLPSVRSEPLVGLTMGGSLTYAYRRPESKFNQVYLLLLARVSTRRVHEYRGDLEIRDIFGRQELFQLGVSLRLDPVFPYYGIANHLNLRGKKFDTRLYTSRVNTAGGYFRYQHRIIRTRRGVWRALFGYAFYSDKIRPSPGSLLWRERPQDLGATRRGTLQAGVTWDSRDNTWNPTRGSAHDLNITVAAPWLGSTKTWGRLSANARFFAPLGDSNLVFATKIGLDGLVGPTENLPLMALGQFGDLPGRDGFGGATSGRGFIRRRFIGRYKGLLTSELRFNAFEVAFRGRPLALGLKGFVDIARVSDTLVPDFRDFEISGGPGLFFVINRFAVVRLDVGISDEFMAMYVLGSHAF
ncbi:MAG: BamA/TamA family outer membrane protein, partial [Nannocystaceae bacterium]